MPGEPESNGVSAYFSSVNWGKEPVSLDLRKPEGHNIALGLVKQADVAVMSFKPGDAAKLGLEPGSLRELNPALVTAEISAYGPEDSRVGFDAIIQAESGSTLINGDPKGPPVKMPVALVDVLAAHQLKEGILLALLRRAQTGEGTEVRVSLLQAAVAALVNQATNYLVGGQIPRRMGSDHPNIVPYGTVFDTKDEKSLVLAIGNHRQFARLSEVLGHPEWPEDPRFADNPSRVLYKSELLPLIRERIAAYTRDDLLAQLLEAQVPAGALHDMEEVFEQEAAAEQILKGKGLRGISGVAWRDSQEVRRTGLGVPLPAGSATRKVMREILNLSESQIDQLIEEEVIQ